MSQKPLLGVTLGDPSGIGPEIAVATLADPTMRTLARGVVYADPAVIDRAIRVTNVSCDVHVIGDPRKATDDPTTIDVVDIGVVRDADQIEWGRVQALAGAAAVRSIERATADALNHWIDGIVTGPINKEASWAAGSKFLGHTEMLASLCHAPATDTMFVVNGLKIFFATRHMSLRDAVNRIDRQLIDAAIARSLKALRVFGAAEPRLAVAALNPHGGEHGHFGSEEIEILAPAVEAFATKNHVVGPIPADAVFHQGLEGKYDGVLSLYHDQGHIASKTYDFDETISVTVGLPILRTSVDHGTAFDIAGTGRASARTMMSAFRSGAELSRYNPAIHREYGSFLS